MTKLDTPDLCARLDSLRKLCDRLEPAQENPDSYRELVRRIRREAEMFQIELCAYTGGGTADTSAPAAAPPWTRRTADEV